MMSRLLLGFAAHQGVGIVSRFTESSEKYALAQEEARIRDKPFLIAGGPAGSADAYSDNPLIGPLARAKVYFGVKAHGCGDLCIDIDPHACDGCLFEEADITNLPFADKEFGAVLSSHVLEHMADAATCQKAWSELHRVADVVFICVPPKSSLFAWLVPDHYLWVRHVGETILEVEERNTGAKYLVDIEGPPVRR
jgi:hypothetical protein